MNNSPEDRLEAAVDAARTAAIPSPEQHARARAQFLLDVQAAQGDSGAGVSSDGDVRLRDQTGALSDLSLVQQGEPQMNRFYRRNRLIAAVMLGVLLAGGFWATPPLRTFAQSVIDFFIPSSTDTQQFSASLDGSRQLAAAPVSGSLSELTAQAEFALALPGYIPAGYQLDAAYYQADDHRAVINYTCDGSLGITVIEQQSATPTEPQKVGASAVIVDVPIRAAIGQYVRGAWMADLDNLTADNEAGTYSVPEIWTNESDWQNLTWRENGINYIVATGGAGDSITDSPCALDKDDLAAIAQGLQVN